MYGNSLSGRRINHVFSWVRCQHAVSTLSVWHKALAKVPPDRILPKGDGRFQKIEAFVGDKLLGAAFAKWIRSQKKKPTDFTTNDTNNNVDDVEYLYDRGEATILASVVLSNKFMADRLFQILPDPAYKDWANSGPAWSTSVLGSLVEASVTAVENVEAVDNLTEWLIAQAKEEGLKQTFDVKGSLLQMGGSVMVERVGGRDSEPIYLAKASLDGTSAKALRGSKRLAERTAAMTCLAQKRKKRRMKKKRKKTTRSR
jgi:hypothetical protein